MNKKPTPDGEPINVPQNPRPEQEPPQSRTALETVACLKPHFDIVRLVDPEQMQTITEDEDGRCESRGCYAVWGKTSRCNNCISQQVLHAHDRRNKLEYSKDGLYFVIAEYVPYGEKGAVLEMVTRLRDDYVDNVFDKELLYVNLDAINRQLDRDDLTGVYNRRYLDMHLGEYLGQTRRDGGDVGLAMLDIDDFKRINDTYGHLPGDRILKKVARMLEGSIARENGDFVARFGGDEFVIVCRGTDAPTLARRIEDVIGRAARITLDEDKTLSIGISAGCATLGELPCASAAELIGRADKRLYIAKGSGRCRVVSRD